MSGASSGYTSETQEAGGRGQDHAHYKSQHWRYSFRRYSESRFRFRYSLVHLNSLSVLWKKIVKLREREGEGVDPGRSLKVHLWMVDGGYPFPDALH